MSKSLKNFITIDVRLLVFFLNPQIVYRSMIRHQDILQKFTPRQLRLAFLSQLWNAKVDFSDSLMTGEVKTIETTFNVRVPMTRKRIYLIPLCRTSS